MEKQLPKGSKNQGLVEDPLTNIIRKIVREDLRALIKHNRQKGKALDPKPYLTIVEATEIVGFHYTIRKAIRTGDLPVQKIDRRVFIRYYDLRDFVDQVIEGGK